MNSTFSIELDDQIFHPEIRFLVNNISQVYRYFLLALYKFQTRHGHLHCLRNASQICNAKHITFSCLIAIFLYQLIFTLGCYVNGCTDCSDNKSSCKKCANDKALLISSYNTKCVSECPLNYDKVDTEGDLKCVIKVVTTRPPPTTKMALKSMTIQTKSKA